MDMSRRMGTCGIVVFKYADICIVVKDVNFAGSILVIDAAVNVAHLVAFVIVGGWWFVDINISGESIRLAFFIRVKYVLKEHVSGLL